MNSINESHLRPQVIGITLALLAILLGWGLGGLFGANEEALKGKLRADAAAVLETAYGGDEAKAKAVTSKSWAYMKRAHLHWSVLGASSLAMIVLLALLGPATLPRRAIGILLGFGSCAYGLFWLWAALRAPGLGSTGAAKESLEWLAVPGAGTLLIGLMGTIATTLKALLGTEPQA